MKCAEFDVKIDTKRKKTSQNEMREKGKIGIGEPRGVLRPPLGGHWSRNKKRCNAFCISVVREKKRKKTVQFYAFLVDFSIFFNFLVDFNIFLC